MDVVPDLTFNDLSFLRRETRIPNPSIDCGRQARHTQIEARDEQISNYFVNRGLAVPKIIPTVREQLHSVPNAPLEKGPGLRPANSLPSVTAEADVASGIISPPHHNGVQEKLCNIGQTLSSAPTPVTISSSDGLRKTDEDMLDLSKKPNISISVL